MKTGKDKSAEAAELRRSAGERLKTRKPSPKGESGPQRLLQEPRVPPSDLEQQNQELQRARGELEAALERCVELYDFAPVGLCTLDDRGLILETNQTMARMLGVVRGGLLGQPLTQFILSEDRDLYSQQYERFRATGAPAACELRLIRPGAVPFWARLEVSRQRGNGAAAPVCRVTVCDITEHKLGEGERERLAQSERLAQLMKCANDMIFLTDEEERILEANESALETYGYSLAELRQMTLKDLRIPESPAELPFQYEQLQTDGRAVFEAVHQRRDGAALPVEISACFIPIAGVRERLCIIRDITARKRAEQALRDSQQRLERVVNHLNDALMVDDVSGRVVYANEKFFHLFQLPKQELHSIVLEDYVAPEWRVQLRDRHDRRIRGEPVPELFEYEGLRSDGTRLWLQVAVTPVWENGRITGTQSAIRDITQRKRAEQELRELSGLLLQAQETERQRIAKELHDAAAQELAAVIMSLGIAQKRLAGGDQEALALVSDSLAVLATTAKDIRELSHLLHPSLLEELGLLGALRQHLAGFGRRTGITVTSELPETWARLSEEAELGLFRVAQEALNNVRQHSGSATVTVRLRRVGQTVTLEVQDRGRGLPAPHRRRDPHGIGIAGMRARLQQLGGTFEIESSHLGATVRAVLNCA